MDRLPRISIVTPALDRETGIAETVQSVTRQDYPNLEHIVVGDAPDDGSLHRLRRLPHLRVVFARHRGWARAVNEGFGIATGDIRGCLDPGDTIAPGALHRVARQLDPARACHVVIGRCRLLDQHGRFVGLWLRRRPEGHLRVLEVWRGMRFPPPAVFWTREAWETCGPFDDAVKSPWVHYDLVCRLSRRYRLHWVDQIFAGCPVHQGSRTEQWTEPERLEDGIEVSRRHWGSPLELSHWRLRLSLAAFTLDRVGRARRNLGQAGEHWRQGQMPQTLGRALMAAILAPEVVFHVSVHPRIRDRAAAAWRRGA